MKRRLITPADEYWEVLKNRAEVSIAHYRGFIFTGLGVAYLFFWLRGLLDSKIPIGLMMFIVAAAIITNILVYTCALLQRGMTIISIVSLVVDSIIIVLLVGMTGGANSIYNILFLFLLIRIMYFRPTPRIVVSAIVLTYLATFAVTTWIANDSSSLWEITSQVIMYTGVFLVANLQADKLKDSIVRHQQVAREMEQQNEKIEQFKDQLERVSMLDPLTQAYNRPFFNLLVDEHFSAKEPRTGTGPLSIILISTLNLKAINTEYGPQKGDEVLRRLAETINAHIREEDYLCRYSGNTLAIVVPGKGEEEVFEIIERCRMLASELNVLSNEGKAISVQVAFGYASTHHGIESAHELIQRAEAELREQRET